MVSLINAIVLILEIVLLAYVISTWVLPPYNSFRMTLGNILEPILAPIRRLIPPMAGFDFSIMVVFIILWVLQNILISILR
jgi:YggT family protein